MRKSAKFALLVSTGLTLAAGGCTLMTMGTSMRDEVAQRIAAPAWMVERQIPASPFSLTAFERMHTHHAPANIYIEGDGLAWVTKRQKSLDPTPKNPVALHLASRDKADNVAYIARPCQYSGMLAADTPCDNAYWGHKRFAPEVIESYQIALDEIKQRYNITSFNLIGFSGGGAVAAILAAGRDDVDSLRTVAGNLDHRAHSAHHEVSYLKGSLNPPDYADKLSGVAQVHYIGGQDDIVPPMILHSYLQALGASSCVKYQFVQEAAHEEGWVNKWPELLKQNVECRGPAVEFEEFELQPEPFYSTPVKPSKP